MTALSYRVYGLVVTSSLPLPELLEEADGERACDVSISEEPSPFGDGASDGGGDWKPLYFEDTQSPWLSTLAVPSGFAVRFRSQAEFRVTADGSVIRCRRLGDTSHAALRHILLDHLLPCVLGHRGTLVVHGSCVALPAGAVVFAGSSLAGKSTTAAALAYRGHRLIADDAAVIVSSGRGSHVVPAYPGLRLWPDSLEAVATNAPVSSHLQYSSKRRLGIDAVAPMYSEGGAALRRIYFLAPRPAEELTNPEILHVSARDAVLEILEHAFLLDPDDRGRLAAQFERVADSDVPSRVRRLRYPLDMSRVQDLVDVVLRDVGDSA